MALKTGTLDDPRSVCGIAGYLRKRNGGWIAFAAIVNGGPAWKHVPLFQAIEAEHTRHRIAAQAVLTGSRPLPIDKPWQNPPADHWGERMPRSLGPWGATAVVVGVTIGSGIFRVPATVAAQLMRPAPRCSAG